MIKKCVCVFIILFNVFLINSQSKRLKIITELRIKGNYKKAIHKIDSFLVNKKYDLTDFEKAILYTEKGIIFKINNNYKKALENYDSLYFYAKKAKDKNLEASYWLEKYRTLSAIEDKKSFVALANYLQLAKETNNKHHLFLAYLSLTQVALKANNTQKASEYLKKVNLYYKPSKKKLLKESNLYYIAAKVYMNQKKYDSARIFISKSLKIRKQIKNKKGILQLNFYLGRIAIEQKKYSSAFNYLQKSYLGAKKINATKIKEGCYAHLFGLLTEEIVVKNNPLYKSLLAFFDVNSIDKAAFKAKNKIVGFKNVDAEKKVFENLHKIYKKLGKTEKSLFYQNKYYEIAIKQMEKNELNTSNFIDLEISLSEIKQQKADLKEQKLALEAKNKLIFNQIIILSFSLLVVILLSLIVRFRFKLKSKSERLQTITAERNLLQSVNEQVKLQRKVKENEQELKKSIRLILEKNNAIELLNKKLKTSKFEDSDRLAAELSEKKYLVLDNWSEFLVKFNQVHANFIKNLTNKKNNLSPTETKLSILVFLNLSSKEIASLLNISTTSVNQGKYRLKKKLALKKSEVLQIFLQKCAL